MRLLLSFLTFALLLSVAACNTAKTATAKSDAMEKEAKKMAPSYAGTWAVTVEDTPLGTTTGTMKIREEDGKLKGSFMTADGNSFRLKGITTTADGMETSFYFPDYDIDVDVVLKGKPADTMLIGQSMGQYRTTAKRME